GPRAILYFTRSGISCRHALLTRPTATASPYPRGFLHFARSTAARSRATCRARSKSCGSNEIAETRGCPPPPYCSASDAKFWSAVAWFHGFVPRDTFARTGDALTLTEYTPSGCSKYGINLLYPSRSRSLTSK